MNMRKYIDIVTEVSPNITNAFFDRENTSTYYTKSADFYYENNIITKQYTIPAWEVFDYDTIEELKETSSELFDIAKANTPAGSTPRAITEMLYSYYYGNTLNTPPYERNKDEYM